MVMCDFVGLKMTIILIKLLAVSVSGFPIPPPPPNKMQLMPVNSLIKIKILLIKRYNLL